jgi:HEAT repeat protein
MRFRIVLPVLVLGLALVCAGLFFGNQGQPVAASAPLAEREPPSAPVPAAPVKSPSREQIKADKPIALTADSGPSEAGQQAKTEYVENRIGELYDLAMTDDPASLRQILGELDNPEPRIRQAAVDAAVQFKSPDAIPVLKDALAQATDLNEKVNLQKAIDFLSLSLPADTNSNL